MSSTVLMPVGEPLAGPRDIVQKMVFSCAPYRREVVFDEGVFSADPQTHNATSTTG